MTSSPDSIGLPIPSVSVVIPTSGSTAKLATLPRAIQSVLAQVDVYVDLIVVINGDSLDRRLYASLQANPQLTVIRFQEGNVSRARLRGLEASSGEFFCFLDDDDEFLPGALAARARAMIENPEADIVVTDGFIRRDGELRSFRDGLANAIRRDPGLAFLHRNWFDSPGSMFRRTTVGYAFFDMPYKHFEWTYLFFHLLCAGKRFHCSEAVTYRKYEDHPESVSKGRDYQLALPAFMRDLLRLPLAPVLRRGLRAKFVVALNQNAGLHLQAGDIRQALASHWQCLLAGGWRYLPFTRKILFFIVRRLARRS